MSGAVVQSGRNVDDTGATSTTIAVTLTGVVAGNHLVAFLGWEDVSSTLTAGVSDGSAFSVGAPAVHHGADTQDGEVFYRENVGAGSHTITGTISGATGFRRLRVLEVSGLATASSLDVTGVGQAQTPAGTGANAVSSTATGATTNATDFVMGFSQDTSESDPATGTVTAGTGYTISGSDVLLSVESKSVAATGAQTATFTQSVNNNRVTHVVPFKEAAGGDTLMGQVLT